jgi:ubiquinone/menaquinone biosynthesis C-methylase UbiE
MAREATVDRARNIALIEGSAESIPLPDHAFDAVVTTWTMCSIPDVVGALSEIRRVLKADGRLVFAEHGLAPSAGVVRWQNALTPGRQVIWRRGPHRRSAKRRLEWTATGRSPRTDHPQGSEPSGIR